MLSHHLCDKCDARLRRSRLRNAFEYVISPLLVPFRCRECDRRQFKFRFLDMNPPKQVEEEDDPAPAKAKAKVQKAELPGKD